MKTKVYKWLPETIKSGKLYCISYSYLSVALVSYLEISYFVYQQQNSLILHKLLHLFFHTSFEKLYTTMQTHANVFQLDCTIESRYSLHVFSLSVAGCFEFPVSATLANFSYFLPKNTLSLTRMVLISERKNTGANNCLSPSS